MRLFFALWPDLQTKKQLAGAAAKLSRAVPSPLVPAGNYHVTLAFLGEVPSSRLPGLLKAGAMQQAPRCTITFDAAEYWPNSRIVVAAAQNPPAGLRKLWEQLHKDLALQSGPALRAHVTLARKVAQAPVLPAMSPIVWSTSSFGLFRSETSGVESAYTVVDTWPLLDET
ncbi:MAG: RNA 2',3'-cyclic phosphodiesterase [Steroidobacteraceae bacterium]